MNYMLFYNEFHKSDARPYDKRYFTNQVKRIFNKEVTLPEQLNEEKYIIDENLSLYPVEIAYQPPCSIFEQLSGPFFTFSDTMAYGRYVTVPKEIDNVKRELKATIASDRYNWEVEGIVVELNGQSLPIPTNREERNIFFQAALLSVGTRSWKFGTDTWVDVTPEDLQYLVGAVVTHVQTCFNWENALLEQINAATTIDELKQLNYTVPRPQPEEPKRQFPFLGME